MSTSESYRRRARQCVTLADGAADEPVRRTYLDLASRWRAIADRQERGESLEQIAGAPKKRRAEGHKASPQACCAQFAASPSLVTDAASFGSQIG
jgi:hypothetical protein